jgi:hypothetical protein
LSYIKVDVVSGNRAGRVSQAALQFASNYGLGMAIVELDLTDRPACCVKPPENYRRPFAPRNVALGMGTDNRTTRSEQPSGQDRS